jgi:hypothetical protein
MHFLVVLVTQFVKIDMTSLIHTHNLLKWTCHIIVFSHTWWLQGGMVHSLRCNLVFFAGWRAFTCY